MHTKENLINNLSLMGLGRGDTVLIHSSMRRIGEVEGGAEGVLDALCEYFSDGLIALPTLTWSIADSEERIFDVRNSPSQVGILPELFRRREGVIRSLHPTHSLAAYGHDAAWLTSEDRLCHTPCGMKSSWHKLLERDAKILMVGCDLTSCTFIHGIEEWNNISGRLADELSFTVIDYDGKSYAMSSRPHLGSPSEQYDRAETALISDGALQKGHLGSADVMLLSAGRTYKTVSRLLRENSALFDEN